MPSIHPSIQLHCWAGCQDVEPMTAAIKLRLFLLVFLLLFSEFRTYCQPRMDLSSIHHCSLVVVTSRDSHFPAFPNRFTAQFPISWARLYSFLFQSYGQYSEPVYACSPAEYLVPQNGILRAKSYLETKFPKVIHRIFKLNPICWWLNILKLRYKQVGKFIFIP